MCDREEGAAAESGQQTLPRPRTAATSAFRSLREVFERQCIASYDKTSGKYRDRYNLQEMHIRKPAHTWRQRLDDDAVHFDAVFFFFAAEGLSVCDAAFEPAEPGAEVVLAACFPNSSARLFMPLVLTFLSASTPRLPLLCSSLRFFAADPPPRSSALPFPSSLAEPRPGRYVVFSTTELGVTSERYALRAGNLQGNFYRG